MLDELPNSGPANMKRKWKWAFTVLLLYMVLWWFDYITYTTSHHIVFLSLSPDFQQQTCLPVPPSCLNSLELSITKKHREYNGNNNHSVFVELQNFQDLVRSHLKDLEITRTHILSHEHAHNGPLVVNVHHIVIADAEKQNYFQVLDNYGGVKTIFLKQPLSVLKRKMRRSYHHGSTGCNMFDLSADHAIHHSKNTCQRWFEGVSDSVPITLDHFKHGLPSNYPNIEDNVTLTFTSIIQDAVVYPAGDVFHNGLHIHPRSCKAYKITEVSITKTFEEVFVVSQAWGYDTYHTMLENIPRLAPYVEFLKKHPSIHIHIAGNTSLTRNMVKALGLSLDRLVTGIVAARIVYLPAGSPCGGGATFNTQMLSAWLRASGANPHQPRDTVILQKRSHRRWFVYHDEIANSIAALAEKYGFKFKIFSDTHLPTFDETIALFDRAVLVVAPHGAGESNMIFARPGTLLIEVMCNPTNGCYQAMIKNLGLRYHGIIDIQEFCFFVHQVGCNEIRVEHITPSVSFFLALYSEGFI